MLKRFSFLPFLFILGLLLPADAFSAAVEEMLGKLNKLSQTERQAALEREARKEGRVVFYTTFNVADLQDIKKLFEQKYPFLKVEPFRLGHGRLANKITTEALAGKLEADAISIPGNYVADFRKLGVIARNRTPLGTQLSDGFVDKEGWIHGMYSTAYVLQYNTKLVKPEELPRDWPDLLDPRWKGQIALDQEGYEWFAGILEFMGEEKGTRFARQLVNHGVAIRRGHTLLSQLVAAGEFKMVLDQYDHIAYRAAQSGSPTNYLFLNPIIAEVPNAIWVTKTSARPHAAALLMDFVLSKEIQYFLSQRGRRMSHKEVSYLPNPPAAHRWIVLSPEKWGPRYGELTKSYRDIFLAK